MRRGVSIAFAAATLALLVPAAPAASAAWWDSTGLDLDRDGLDDALDGAAGARRVLVDYAAPPTAAERAAVEALGATIVREIAVVPVLVVDAPAAILPALARAPGVVLVEDDAPIVAALDESRKLVRGDVAAKSLAVTGKGVTIAVLDTGVDVAHPDFPESKLLASFDASLPKPPLALPAILGGAASRAPAVPGYADGHATHVAGIAAGSGGEGGGRFIGVAPGAAIVNVKVFTDAGDASSSTVLVGLDWVVANAREHGIRIMQMSLGGRPTDGSDALSRAIDVASDRGLLTVAAAGNAGPDAGTIGVPGVASRALTVGAVDKGLKIAPFSSRGPTPDGREKPEIVAPGVDVTSALPLVTARGAYYGPLSGTSMAAPHVAGAAALLFEANASLSPALAKFVLVAASKPIGPTPHEWNADYGWGFLDVAAAVRAARDPAILAGPEFAATADGVPFDGPVSPIEKLAYEVGRAERAFSVAAPPALAALAALASVAVLALARGRAGGR